MRIACFALLAVAVVVPPLAACGTDAKGTTAAPTADPTSTTPKPGGGSSGSSSSSGSSGTTDPTGDAGPPPVTTCTRTAQAADRLRKVVISHPYDNTGGKANAYQVLELSTAGVLSKTDETFQMHRGLNEIAFTPDGEVGIVAQDDGTLGVFKFDANGKVVVVNAGFKGTFYAEHVVVSHDGTRAFVLDPDTKDNRGGVYEVKIGCDGNLQEVGLVVPGGKAHAMALIPTEPDKAVLIAGGAFDSPAGDYSHKLDVKATPTRLSGGPVFADDNAIASGVAVTPDGKWALVTDNGFFAGNRMAPIAVDTMKAGASIAVLNPAGVAMSPFGNAALLMESDGEDHLMRVTYDSTNTTAPFALAEEIAYADGNKASLPVLASTIDVGSLKGRVLVSENDGIRQLQFGADGKIKDLGKLVFDGFLGIPASLGVQP